MDIIEPEIRTESIDPVIIDDINLIILNTDKSQDMVKCIMMIDPNTRLVIDKTVQSSIEDHYGVRDVPKSVQCPRILRSPTVIYHGSREVRVIHHNDISNIQTMALRDVSSNSLINCKCKLIINKVSVRYQVVFNRIIHNSMTYLYDDIGFDTSDSTFIHVVS